MTDLQALGVGAIVVMVTIQSLILMLVVNRLTRLESALSAISNRTLMEDRPDNSTMAMGWSYGRPSNDSDRRGSIDAGVGRKPPIESR